MDPFGHERYLLRKKVLKILGGAFHIFDEAGNVVAYAKQAFKLREDIRLYTGEDMTQELLTINARKIVDWSAAYDVRDPRDGSTVGALRRRGMRSMIQDEWTVLDQSEREIGTVVEDSTALALIRRFVTNLLPQTYHVTIGGEPAAIFGQRFNPFVYRLEIDFSPDRAGRLDRRLGLAAAVLLGAVEGRQG